MKKYLSILIIITMISTLIPSYATVVVKDDITGHWAEVTLRQWQEKDLIKGYPDGTIRPDNDITKVEFITLVNRIYGYYEEADENYTDVSESLWYTLDCKIAKANGYMDWYQGDSLNPIDSILREEVFAILATIMQVEATEDLSAIDGFADKEDIPKWCVEYIDALVSSGYIKGNPDMTVEPQDAITRAEAVTMLDRVMGEIINESGTYGAEEGAELETIAGNLTVNIQDVILKNMIIAGNLILAAGIGDGDIDLNNVTVNGRTIINGGGENSITITGSNLGEIRVYKIDGQIRVVLAGSKAEIVILQSGGELEGEYNGAEIIIEPKAGQEVILDGSFESIVVDSEVDIQVMDNSTIEEITFNVAAEVTGKGKISKVMLNSNGVIIEQKVKEVIVVGIDTSGVKEYKPSGGGTTGGGGSHVKSNQKQIIATIIGDLYNGNIIDVPANTKVSVLKEGLTISDKATVEILNSTGGAPILDQANTDVTENMVVQVTAENVTTADYTIALEDNKAPTYNVDPSAEVGDNEGEIKFTVEINEDGKVYYIVTDEPLSTTPVAVDIKNESVAGAIETGIQSLKANTKATSTVQNLLPDKQHYIYLVVEDTSGNFADVKELTAKSKLVQGDGSPLDPYKIWYIEDLEKVGTDKWYWDSTKSYKLMRHLDFYTSNSYRVFKDDFITGEGWKPLESFTGIFNGNGKTISGIYINRNSEYVGLFSTLGDKGTIIDLGILSVDITGDYAGGIAGENYGTITNSYSTGDIAANNYAGGIAGYNSNGTIENSYSTGDIAANYYAGGIAGGNSNGTIKNSYSTGDITSIYDAGGIAGYSNGTIENSYSTGDITSGDYAGGIAAKNDDEGTITSSCAYNKRITGSNGVRVVGRSGEIAASITNSYAKSSMLVNGTTQSGTNADSVVGADIDTLTDISSPPLNDWDFINIWELLPGAVRPTLKGVGNDNGL